MIGNTKGIQKRCSEQLHTGAVHPKQFAEFLGRRVKFAG
jgi:hypothetical protein